MFFLYNCAVEFVMERFQLLSGIIQFLPIGDVYPIMAGVSLALGGGLGFIVSFMTIRRHLRV
jgi:cell division transport system permease protein